MGRRIVCLMSSPSASQVIHQTPPRQEKSAEAHERREKGRGSCVGSVLHIRRSRGWVPWPWLMFLSSACLLRGVEVPWRQRLLVRRRLAVKAAKEVQLACILVLLRLSSEQARSTETRMCQPSRPRLLWRLVRRRRLNVEEVEQEVVVVEEEEVQVVAAVMRGIGLL